MPLPVWLLSVSAWSSHLHRAQSLPLEFREGLNVIHEGIDTELAVPNPTVNFEVRGERIDRNLLSLPCKPQS